MVIHHIFSVLAHELAHIGLASSPMIVVMHTRAPNWWFAGLPRTTNIIKTRLWRSTVVLIKVNEGP